MTGADPSQEFWRDRTVVVTGGKGFLGTFVVKLLQELGASVRAVSSSEHDLRVPQQAIEALDGADVVINLAAKVGGIGYNRRNPAPLIRDNVLIAVNVFDAALDRGVAKLVTAGSVCAYPNETPIPFREEEIWNGYPEETNAPYGIAKRVVQELARTYRAQHDLNAVVPVLANLYGPGDNFDPEDSHVVPALIRKFIEAEERDAAEVSIWGTGRASREFLFVADGARALVLAGERLETPEPVNIGTGKETSIRELVEAIRENTGFRGEISWDASRPDGQLKRNLDISAAREKLGYEPAHDLSDGLAQTIAWYRENRAA